MVLMYFGKSNGLIVYDGETWEHHNFGNTVRSGVQAEDGTIYLGTVGDFGMLVSNDSSKTFALKSFKEYIPKDQQDFTDVFSVIEHKNTIFFQTYYRIFAWNKETKKITSWETKYNYHRMFLIKDKLYLRQEDVGLTEMKLPEAKAFKPVKGGEKFAKLPISVMLPFKKDKILIGTQNTGIFIYEPKTNKIEPWNKALNQMLKGIRLYNGLYQPEKNSFILGTLGNGILITDLEGNIKQNINKDFGLLGNALIYMAFDNQNGLWLGTTEGICRVDMASAFSIWDQSLGIEGAPNQIIRYNNLLYASTEQGVFYLDTEVRRFKRVSNILIQPWGFIDFALENGEKKLLVVATDGLFEINGTEGKRVYNERFIGGLQSKINPKYIYLNSPDAMLILKYNNGNWEEYKSIPEVKENYRSMYEDKKGVIWLASSFSNNISLKKISFDKNQEVFLENYKYTEYDTTQIPPVFGFGELRDTTYFFTPKGIYYEAEKNKFLPAIHLDKKLKDYPNVTMNGFLNNEELGIFGFFYFKENRDSLPINSEKFQRNSFGLGTAEIKNGKIINIKEDIFKQLADLNLNPSFTEENGIIWVIGQNRIYRFDMNLKEESLAKLPKVQIRKVSIQGDSIIYIKGITSEKQVPKIDYKNNSIRFDFAFPYFSNIKSNQYRYYLEGYDKKWSEWTEQNFKEYTNLHEGRYVFKVQAKNILGEISEETEHIFVIKPPWYRSILAYISYIALGLVFVLGTVRVYTNRLQRQKKILEHKVEIRTKEVQQKNRQLLQKQEEILVQSENLKEANEDILAKNVEIEQQNEEILAQRDTLEKSYKNVQLLSEIGQKITAQLSVENIVSTAYQNINEVMSASVFGIGVFNEEMKRLEFRGTIESNKVLAFHTHKLDDDYLAVWSFNNKQEILINDIEKEFHNYLKTDIKAVIGELPQSIIYLPIYKKNTVIGVLTVQCFQKQAYTEYHINLLRNLGIYISIALENAEVYAKIRESNWEIESSIEYAKRIQDALLPKQSFIKKLIPYAFILHKPRDIVSGDFYWLAEKEEQGKITIAAVDCTGHGVPGAFMSMIADALLTRIVHDWGIHRADLILNNLHQALQKELDQDKTEVKDGMDMALVIIDKKKRELQFAGAKNPLLLFKNGKEKLIKADRMEIGGEKNTLTKEFTLHTFPLEEIDFFYIYSDGYQDQFGGEKNKKITAPKFRELLKQVHQKTPEEQQDFLSKYLEDWKGKQAQIDDILLIGVNPNS